MVGKMKTLVLSTIALVATAPTLAAEKHLSMVVKEQLKHHGVGDYVFQWCVGETKKRRPNQVRLGYAVYIVKTTGEPPLINIRSGRDVNVSGILLTKQEASCLATALEDTPNIWKSIPVYDAKKRNIGEVQKEVEVGDILLRYSKRGGGSGYGVYIQHLHAGELGLGNRQEIVQVAADLARMLKDAQKHLDVVKENWPSQFEAQIK